MITITPRIREYAVLVLMGVVLFVLMVFVAPRAVSKTISKDVDPHAGERAIPVAHITTPDSVRGIYVTSFTAGN